MTNMCTLGDLEFNAAVARVFIMMKLWMSLSLMAPGRGICTTVAASWDTGLWCWTSKLEARSAMSVSGINILT